MKLALHPVHSSFYCYFMAMIKNRDQKPVRMDWSTSSFSEFAIQSNWSVIFRITVNIEYCKAFAVECSNDMFAFCFCCHLHCGFVCFWIFSHALDCWIMNCIFKMNYHFRTLLNNNPEAKIWKWKGTWSWNGRSWSACCTLTRATFKRPWRFQETSLLGRHTP